MDRTLHDSQNTLALPAVENVLTYERQVAEIGSAMQSKLAEVVNAQYLEANRQVQWFVENVSQNIPSAPSLQSHF
ncbi:hypothetical protein [Paraburkholderia hospita]|jgi:hypothetical protein|uniref:hypothetical protein n=1 Tax=Paraburkholderia hospita TaxID=169430 RepID=UPI000271BF0E|nr:hypothetical protein [Paraburkholderia hospita]EUC12269.1 hypothetical protein PMI06_008652 [Burkholderia sp. BT03]SEI22630.1 hypothetical protein SAMN05192544_104420 [Paraburkholderia hospita]